MKKIGLALGGGGARGLAHIPMLEVFDQLGIRPHRVAGTSIGAIIGALYTSGIKGEQIRQLVQRMVVARGQPLREVLRKKDALKWVEFMDVGWNGRGLFKGDKIVEFLCETIKTATFEELEIPLRVVAADFGASRQVVLESGPLAPAVRASMSLPGLFAPAILNDRILIDGGAVNPVPHDLLEDCDIVVAIDVMGFVDTGRRKVPGPFRALIGTFQIMQNSIIAEKLKRRPPDVYIRPELAGINVLDFHKAQSIYRQTEPARVKLEQELRRLFLE